jgi:SAM-dependent methyltransferase
MHPAEYATLRSAEDHHWWYQVLHHQVAAALKGRLPPHGRLLDAGCGTGGMLDFLRGPFPSLHSNGIDLSPLAVQHARNRSLANIQQASAHNLPFKAAAFDAVLSLDVLYHEDIEEARAMQEMARVLKPGGLLVLNLPAFPCLRGSHDVAVCGVRRYKSCHVRPLLELHNLSLEMIHYWNAWLFLPLLLWRRSTRARPSRSAQSASDVALTPSWLNDGMARLGLLDARLCRLCRAPFGSSLFAVAKKADLPAGGPNDARE